MRRRIVFLVVVLGLAGASCGGGEESSDSTQAASATTTSATVATSSTTTTIASIAPPGALHPVPADSVGVTGTAACTFSSPGEFTVKCQLDMSDPRVSGSEVSDNYWFFDEDDGEDEEETVSTMWVADAVLKNEEGTWRGITQAGDDTTPCGETHYVGEGAYTGLEFHYYFCHVDEKAQLRGWIYKSES
jgi:hypothetical protein